MKHLCYDDWQQVGRPVSRGLKMLLKNIENTERKLASKTITSRIKFLVYLLAYFTSSCAYENRGIAFFYGKHVPIELLANFKQVVIEPDNMKNPEALIAKGVDLYAYLSVGEINENRTWYEAIRPDWLSGKNPAWGSHIVDLSQEGWQDFLLNKIMAPLWKNGYRGFFLDALDSYMLATDDPKERLLQKQALIKLIRAMHTNYPGIKLIINRGFELLPSISDIVTAVAAESLFQSWNPSSGTYTEVNEADRVWLSNKLNEIQKKYGLQIIVIDYVPPKQRDLARDVADKIEEAGFTPWVTNHAVDMMGISNQEVSPKRILTLIDSKNPVDNGAFKSKAVSLLEKLMVFAGYTFEYIDVRDQLPNYCLAGKYTAIITRLNSAEGSDSLKKIKIWLDHQDEDGIRIITFGEVRT